MGMEQNTLYQVSTLQALSMGYTRPVVTVRELLEHGNIGLGTFEGVNGEMILIDGHCYRADEEGKVVEMPSKTGVPFASVTFLQDERRTVLPESGTAETLKQMLDKIIEEWFGLNSMHMIRIDGFFIEIQARSENAYFSQHISLKDILSETQKSFVFSNIPGTLVCVYYPDYMAGINAAGWHFHFISEDRTLGGHVFDLHMLSGAAVVDKIQRLAIQLPTEPSFDTYSLTEASQQEIKQVEQGKE